MTNKKKQSRVIGRTKSIHIKAQGIFIFGVSVLLGTILFMSQAILADTIMLNDGATIVGEIQFGIATMLTIGGSSDTAVDPGRISKTTAMLDLENLSGNSITVQREDVKVLRLGDPSQRNDIITTYDGKTLKGKIGGIAESFWVKTGWGDILSVRTETTKEIRFEGIAGVASSVTPTAAAVTRDPDGRCGNRSPLLSAAASLIIPGIGQLMNGESALKVVGYWGAAPLLPGLANIASAIDAYLSAENMNRCGQPFLKI